MEKMAIGPALSASPRAAGTAASPSELPWPFLREAYFLFRERWAEHLRRFDLSLSDYLVLELCAQDPAKASEVARFVGLTAAGATDLIDRLESRRLVHRVAHPNDRRVVLIRLTSTGQRLYREARSSTRATLRQLNGAMSAEERRALTAGLVALGRALRRDFPRTRGSP
jgi:DNA-binding MarR family transcriptional regulator